MRNITAILRRGGVGILPTDTLYGLVGSALSKKAVARIYQLRKRDPKKPLIVLIGSFKDLAVFGIKLNNQTREFLRKVWPGKVSVILPCGSDNFVYLHRGAKSLAFRLPKDRRLADLLKNTGPLVAPSANLEGRPPAKTIAEAKRYFGNKADFYIDGGKKDSSPSLLVEIKRF